MTQSEYKTQRPGASRRRAGSARRTAEPLSAAPSGCACGGTCPRCQQKPLQLKVQTGTSSNRHEREADAAAHSIARGQTPGAVSRVAAGAMANVDAPASVHDTLSESGRPLDSGTRTFMESRFGNDFSNVRVHHDGRAAASAQALHARAYTHGDNVVFGVGQYAPHTGEGRQLLAHELTHVVQQRGSVDAPIQRAEIDDRAHTCAGLEDSREMINDEVNWVLQVASAIPDGLDRVEYVYEALGAGSPFSGIEDFIEEFPETHQNRVSIENSKYRSTLYGSRGGSGFVNAWWKGERALGTVINLGGRCIGSDKLGHFFQQGRDYFVISKALGKGDAYAEDFGKWLEGKASDDPTIQAWIDEMDAKGWPGFDTLMGGVSFWKGVFGLSTTGVFSPGDLAANSEGMAFYKKVYANPDFDFDILAYTSSQWNEEKNPSCHGKEMSKLLAANDPAFIKEYKKTVSDAIKSNPFMSAYAGKGIFESLVQKYIKKYQCP